ncbi:MAG: GGDEF domain-containing protein [Phycisphaerae bacterium]
MSSKARILLFDQDLAGASQRCAHLTEVGWMVLHHSDPIEALSAVQSDDVDLAVLHLPVEDMLEMDLPHVIQTVADSEYLPVMVLTDSHQDLQYCRFLESGADEVVSRELSADEVVARIRVLLRMKVLSDRLEASKIALRRALDRERDLLEKLREDNAHLRTLCTTDPLTRVQNVRSFRELLGHEWRNAKRYNHPISLLMLDLDHFKLINDNYGHPSGDYVLKELAVILKTSVRESDVVARTGGEEFSVILPRANPRQARKFAERIRREVSRRKFTVFGKDIHVTISIGSANYPQNAEITEEDMLLYFADQALLRAKEEGRDRVKPVNSLPLADRVRMRKQYHQMQQTLAAEPEANRPAAEPASQYAGGMPSGPE